MTATPPELLPDLPSLCWPVDTSCIPDWDAVVGEGEAAVPKYSDAVKDRALALAAQTLRMLTGYRVGGCPITVRPSTRRCRTQTWRTFQEVGGEAGPGWSPVSVGGQWMNIGCGHGGDGCGCLTTREVVLPGASIIVEVRVDGLVLDPEAYRLDPGGRLVRLDAAGWPLCQDLALEDTEDGTWSVAYLSGAPVDGLGAWAAGLLTREYLTACTGGQCRLPSTVTQVVRNGVTITMTPGAFPDGLTGIAEVDQWVARWNPNRLKTAPVVWSPDLPRHRRTAEAVEWTQTPDDIDGGTA